MVAVRALVFARHRAASFAVVRVRFHDSRIIAGNVATRLRASAAIGNELLVIGSAARGRGALALPASVQSWHAKQGFGGSARGNLRAS